MLCHTVARDLVNCTILTPDCAQHMWAGVLCVPAHVGIPFGAGEPPSLTQLVEAGMDRECLFAHTQAGPTHSGATFSIEVFCAGGQM